MIFMTDEIQEMNLNIQLLMYAHTWESTKFLNTLCRIGGILNGDGYIWKTKVERTKKTNFINDHILKKLTTTSMGRLVSSIYNSELRNDFAHSTYNIDMERGEIHSVKDGYSNNKAYSFQDFEEIFLKTVFLSYHLIRQHQNEKNKFLEHLGNSVIKMPWPTSKDPHRYFENYLKAEIRGSGTNIWKTFGYADKNDLRSNLIIDMAY